MVENFLVDWKLILSIENFFTHREFFCRSRIFLLIDNFLPVENFMSIENFVDREISCQSRNFFVDREISSQSRNFFVDREISCRSSFSVNRQIGKRIPISVRGRSSSTRQDETDDVSLSELIGYQIYPHKWNFCTISILRGWSPKLCWAFPIFLLVALQSFCQVRLSIFYRYALRLETRRTKIGSQSVKVSYPINSSKEDTLT